MSSHRGQGFQAAGGLGGVTRRGAGADGAGLGDLLKFFSKVFNVGEILKAGKLKVCFFFFRKGV